VFSVSDSRPESRDEILLRGVGCNTPGVTSVLSRVVKAGENHLNEFLDFFLDFKTRLK
jgi:hypothetical protein